MKQRKGTRIIGLLLAVLFAFPFFSPLTARADDYDERYPEILEDGHLTASSAILIEADSGQVIFEKSPDQILENVADVADQFNRVRRMDQDGK